jgi:tRNA dimethylallyltransferase
MVVIVIAGPTGVGKTKVAIELAKKLNCNIINADSRQLYKEITIGTAKPSDEELSDVKHYFVNTHSIQDIFTTGDFEKQALNIINTEIGLGNKFLIVAGGTGMYINALLNGLDELPNGDENIRNQLQSDFDAKGISYLQNKLQELDKEAFSTIAKDNPQRIMRAIEVCLITGKKYSDFLNKKLANRKFTSIKIALNLERDKLYSQINRRVDNMLLNGLENEAKEVYLYRNLYALKTVGYNELFDYFEGKITYEKAIELIKQHTRNYAKRQITWFKKDQEFNWFSPNDLEKICNFIEGKIQDEKKNLI